MATEVAWHDVGVATPARRTQQTLGWIVGLLLPLYLLDESVALKAMLSPLIGASCVALLLVSRFNTGAGSELWRLLALGLALSYPISLFGSVLGDGVGVNAFYPLLFLALCFRVPFATNRIVRGLCISLVGVVLFGWVRFITGEGGVPAEHALGYWGIKYTEATRNNDVLAPLMLSGIALATMKIRTTDTPVLFMRWGPWMSLVLALPALALSFSRSAWLAAICFLLLNSGFNWRTLLKSVIALFAAATVLLVVVNVIAPDLIGTAVDLVALTDRFLSIFDPKIESSNGERSRLLAYAISVGLEHPLLGVGSGRFDCCFAKLGFYGLRGSLHPENLFLHLFSELGFFVAFFSLTLLIIAGRYGLRSGHPAPHFAATTLMTFVVWLQFNSELPSLLVWAVLGIACSVSLSRAR